MKITSRKVKKMIIEKMTLVDFEAIKEKLQSDFDEFWSPGILKSELENSNSKYIVAKENNEIIGFAGIIVTPIDVEITNIVTKKSNRKKGIGKLLLDKLIEMAKELKSEKISLEVNEKNNIAIHLYENCGFEKVGLRKKYYNGENNAIIMTKALNI